MGLLAEKFMDFVGVPEDEGYQDSYDSDSAADAYNASIQPGVVLMKPTDFSHAREIIDHLVPNHAIVINLEGVETSNLRRMVDFFAGVAYGIQGTFVKASRLTYVIVPPDVEYVDERFDKWDQEDPLAL